MVTEDAGLAGPDLAEGIALSALAEGVPLLGHAHGQAVLLARHRDEVFAVGAFCTHYGAPLGDGLIVGDTVRCRWHHACFRMRTGEALRASALDPISCWQVERRGHRVYVGDRRVETGSQPSRAGAAQMPESIDIVGGGAAGNAAAETLRREGYAGTVTVLSADDSLPCDRPNLSKGYLAGSAADGTDLLRSPAFFQVPISPTCCACERSPTAAPSSPE